MRSGATGLAGLLKYFILVIKKRKQLFSVLQLDQKISNQNIFADLGKFHATITVHLFQIWGNFVMVSSSYCRSGVLEKNQCFFQSYSVRFSLWSFSQLVFLASNDFRQLSFFFHLFLIVK